MEPAAIRKVVDMWAEQTEDLGAKDAGAAQHEAG